jgi:hypothetical protein
LKEISGLLQHKEGLKENGNRALKLCLQTSQDTQAIFPRRLAEALARLKVQPLAQDADVRGLYELNLDVHDRWIGEDARNYTPRPRHDELQRAEAERLLHQWSKQAMSAFLKGIKSALEDTRNMKEVAELRQDLIETWIVSGSRMAGVKSKNVLDDLRDTMMGQLEDIVRSRTQNLRGVVEEISRTLGSWKHQDASLSLWTATSTAPSLSNGAQGFKQRILNTHQGRDSTVVHIMQTFDSWMDSVLEVKLIVKSMKETRWDDPFTDDVSLSDSSDEFGDDSNSKQTLLSADDPRLLEEVTQDALAAALSSLGKSFARLDVDGDATNENEEESENPSEDTRHVQKAVFLLRIIREISDRIPRLRVQDKSSSSSSSSLNLTSPFTPCITHPLRTTLAKSIIQPTITSYQTLLSLSLSLSNSTHSNARSKSYILWEGNPPLPAQPSPSAFRFLQGLVKRMGAFGADLWAPESVKVVKGLAEVEVRRCWMVGLEGIQGDGEGGGGGGDGDGVRATFTAGDGDKEKEGADEFADENADGDGDGDETEVQEKDNETDAKDNNVGAQTESETEKKENTTPSNTNELKQEKLKQLLFDALYMQRFLAPAPSATAEHSPNPSSACIEALCEAAAVNEAMRARLNKHAGDYWRKTYLLFALLA